LDWIVVDTFDESVTCVYVAVVLIVRHALHDVTHTPIMMIVTAITTFFMFFIVLFSRNSKL